MVVSLNLPILKGSFFANKSSTLPNAEKITLYVGDHLMEDALFLTFFFPFSFLFRNNTPCYPYMIGLLKAQYMPLDIPLDSVPKSM